jgi:hypothetical protein
MAGFAFVFAPIAIKIVPEMGTFATLIGSFIRGLSSVRRRVRRNRDRGFGGRAIAPESRKLAVGRIALVSIGLVASAYETTTIIPRMEATAAQIPGAIDSVPKDDPRRAAYDEEHHQSTRVYGHRLSLRAGRRRARALRSGDSRRSRGVDPSEA